MSGETGSIGGKRRTTVASAVAHLREPGEEQFIKVLEHGSMEVELYAPRVVDGQASHRRDELYVVVSGTGEFVNGPERHPFGPDDVLFVPAATLKARRRKRIHAHLFLRGDVAFARRIRQLRAVGHCRLARPRGGRVNALALRPYSNCGATKQL